MSFGYSNQPEENGAGCTSRSLAFFILFMFFIIFPLLLLFLSILLFPFSF